MPLLCGSLGMAESVHLHLMVRKGVVSLQISYQREDAWTLMTDTTMTRVVMTPRTLSTTMAARRTARCATGHGQSGKKESPVHSPQTRAKGDIRAPRAHRRRGEPGSRLRLTVHIDEGDSACLILVGVAKTQQEERKRNYGWA